MDLCSISDTLTIATYQGIGFAKLIVDRHHYFAGNSTISLSPDSSDAILRVTAGIVSINAIAPPPVKPKTSPRTLLRRKRRIKRRSFTGDDSNDGEEFGFFLFGSDGGDGFGNVGGGGDSGGGGNGWNFGGFGGQNWDESSSFSPWTVTALDFVYEVISWIALSNCVHFAFKKMVRIAANGISEAGDREKVPM